MVEFVFNLLIYVTNTFIVLLSKVLAFIVSVLPNSPFLNIVRYAQQNSMVDYLGYLAWLIPIKQMLIVLFSWLGGMLAYYLYSVIMRWLKMIE